MLRKQRNKLAKNWFNYQVREILETPPLVLEDKAEFIVLSQLHSPDLLMYLLAAKSLARFLPPARFVVVDDGLSRDEHDTISKHVGRVDFVPITSIDVGKCPTGGTWERINAIAGLNDNHYVIQMDADTLTLSHPHEVEKCVKDHRSFTLGTSLGEKAIPVDSASKFADGLDNSHVQTLAERALVDLPNSKSLKYVRGCSGFAGFRKETLSAAKLSDFSSAMSDLIGLQRWSQWGSEQFTSNFFVANDTNALVLPFDFYPYVNPKTDLNMSHFIHFVGSRRFRGGVYARFARRVIQEIQSS